MHTLQSGHTVIRADQFGSDGWQLPEITELCQNNDEGRATNYMSVIAHMYQRPRCMDDDTPAGDHVPASTRSCRPRQKATPNGDGPTRSHPTNPPTSSPRFKSGEQTHGLFKTMSGIYGRALDATSPMEHWDDQTVETSRTLHVVRMRGILRHPVSGISGVDPHGTIRGHSACIATKRATRDEEQQEQCCEYSGGSVGARKSPVERQSGNPVEEGAERLRPSTDCDPEGRQRCDALRTMRDVWESVAAHSPDHGGTGSRDEAEQSHNACVHREATGRDRTPLFFHTDTGA